MTNCKHVKLFQQHYHDAWRQLTHLMILSDVKWCHAAICQSKDHHRMCGQSQEDKLGNWPPELVGKN